MSKKILFSSIGGNDPISSTTEHDGSMLHICRVYMPDEVYIYLSSEMYKRELKDNRYTYCIAKLGEYMNHNFNVHCINREELINVQDFDYYYKDFGNILREITDKFPGADFVFNVASGTPAMKSALLFLATLSERKIIPVQVTTPIRSINKHSGKDEDYDVEYYWEVNQDNKTDYENRCKEVECPNLGVVLKKNIIKKHIKEYDYAAAQRVAEEIKENLTRESFLLINAAVRRQQLELSGCEKILREVGADLIPIKNGEYKKVFEYALGLIIKIIRKEYGDFVRAISPLITILFEMIVEKKCNVNLEYYLEGKSRKISVERLRSNENGQKIINILNEEYKNGFKDKTPLASSNLKAIICGFLDASKEYDRVIIDMVTELRNVEEKVRNIAAHEIVSITDEMIMKTLDGKFTAKKIMDYIKSMFSYIGICKNDEIWNSYDVMNQYIINSID